MSDTLTPAQRHKCMSLVKGKDTAPEFLIRKALFAEGFRYKLHDKSLPGKPDLVFPKYKAVIFIHGCFWHMHDCPAFSWPVTRKAFWKKKITGNAARDKKAVTALNDQGWRVLIVWECALKGKIRLPIDKVITDTAKWLKTGKQDNVIQGKSKA
ncbi:MAG: very short patch repair endonuclease [Gammaproteobacteria bacterium]|nr:very short patch repair endonuclease [Gammaproteobacteria bacterium]MDH5650709.1 very short patch repair endonuclease [Gammaproteobacteria bacterium]